MWQRILAVDSGASKLRTGMAADGGDDLRPLYLKRRLQLLQGDGRPTGAGGRGPADADRCDPDIVDDAGRGPIRNRRYLSLRVKLLKRQFGLPGDVLSLRSLSLASSSGVTAGCGNVAPNENDENVAKDRFSYGGVRHVSDAHGDKVTRMVFAPSPDGAADRLFSSSLDGAICVSDLDASGGPAPSFTLRDPHGAGVADFDLSQSGDLVISSAIDGRLVLWGVADRSVLRMAATSSPSFCRFLPRNNNLVVFGEGSSGAARVFNVSTGKMDPQAVCPLLGTSLCVEFGQRGSVLWVGNDRGHVESVRVSCGEGGVTRLQKGCRVSLADPTSRQQQQQSLRVEALSFRAAARAADKPILLASLGSRSVRLFSVVDDFGTLEGLADFACGGGVATLLSATLAPLLCALPSVCCAAGTGDGSVVLMDLEREDKSACVVNKLLGHSKPVISLAFNQGETLLASADSSGQIIVWKK